MDPRTRDPEDDGLIRRSFGLTVKSVDEKSRTAHFVFSDASLDSADEIVDQDWDLSRYEKNPVVLYDHNRVARWSDDPKHSLPIGFAKNVGIYQGALQGDVTFVSEAANPMAEMCWRCITEGALRAGSVGFMPGDVRSEVHDGKDVYRLSKCKLFEFSITPIGACENAIINSATAERDREILKNLAAKTAANDPKPAPKGDERPNMDPEKMKAEIERLTASEKAATEKVTAAEKTIADLTAKNGELQSKLDASEKKVGELQESVDKAEGETIAAEVKSLVGKKIAPAQTEKFIKLRLEWGKDEFDAFVKDMADLPYTKEVTQENGETNTNGATGRRKTNKSKVLAAALAAAEKASGEDVEVEA